MVRDFNILLFHTHHSYPIHTYVYLPQNSTKIGSIYIMVAILVSSGLRQSLKQ